MMEIWSGVGECLGRVLGFGTAIVLVLGCLLCFGEGVWLVVGRRLVVFMVSIVTIVRVCIAS